MNDVFSVDSVVIIVIQLFNHESVVQGRVCVVTNAKVDEMVWNGRCHINFMYRMCLCVCFRCVSFLTLELWSKWAITMVDSSVTSIKVEATSDNRRTYEHCHTCTLYCTIQLECRHVTHEHLGYYHSSMYPTVHCHCL